MLWLIKRAIEWWHARQRDRDMYHLWAECKELSGNVLPVARDMFVVHALEDPAWAKLGEAEIRRRLEELT